MGGSSWSDDHYTARAAVKLKAGKPAFDHDHDVKTGAKPFAIHDNLNVRGKIRESRDSAAHPESLAIGVVCDGTGSMAEVPKIVQSKLPLLMGLLVKRGFADHPQICFGMIGDFRAGDRAPLQIGQFESGAEMDDDLTRMILEGGGGGGYEESYQNALYFFAHRTACDCFEKRGKKGYLFVIGDEKAYRLSLRSELETLLGVSVQADVPLAEIVSAAKEKWEVFFIIPNRTTHYGDPKLREFWVEQFGGQNVLMLEDPAAVSELIATTIGIAEGKIDLDGAKGALADAGASGKVVDAVTSSVAEYANSAALARVGSGDLPEGTETLVRV